MFWDSIRVKALIDAISYLSSAIIDKFFVGEGIGKPEKLRKVYIFMPTVLVIGLNLMDYSITDAIKWMYLNTNKYFLLVFLLVISEIVGGFIDSIIALYRYHSRRGFTTLTMQQRFKIIKFGDDEQVLRGEGRYDIDLKHILYGFVSNITGALCPLTMLLFIKTLPNFLEFVEKTNWFDYFALCSPFTVIPGLQQTAAQLLKPIPDNVDSPDDNPDNYLLNRFHTFFSFVSLWFTITMVTIFGLAFYVYGICNFRQYTLSIYFALPVMALTIFLLYQSCSKMAIKYKAVNVKTYIVGLVIMTLIVVSSIVLFKFSTPMIGAVILSTLSLSSWGWMIHRINRMTKTEGDWEKYTKWIFPLPILFFIVVVVMVFIQKLHINT